MKLLLTGDVHLGRFSSALSTPDVCVDRSAAGALSRIVDLAISEDVAAVLVSGDLVDARNRYFEATGPLRRGIKRLTDEGIEFIAVAGNHDHNVTPTLLRSFAKEGLKASLLGAGGKWEVREVVRSEGTVRIAGWSFPSDRVEYDPTADFPDELFRGDTTPAIGIVHGDLDITGSQYGQLSSRRLAELPLRGWLLGHIHARSIKVSDSHPWILYPGSPQALDAGERGQHGAWLLELDASELTSPRFVPLSTVQYEKAELSLTLTSDTDDVRPAIEKAIRDFVETLALPSSVVTVVLDLELSGETPSGPEVEQAAQELLDAPTIVQEVEVRVRTVANRVAPPLSLDELARGRGITGRLARAIMGMERDDDPLSTEAGDLMRHVTEAVKARPIKGNIMDGDRERDLPLTDTEIRQRAAIAARRLLAAIVGSRMASPQTTAEDLS